jgi:RHS repeat-associated protein
VWDQQNYLLEADGSNVVTTVYTNEPQIYGRLTSTTHQGSSKYHHIDAIGSIRATTDATAVGIGTALFSCWGATVQSSFVQSPAFQWSGSQGVYADGEIGAYCIRRREYIPSLARWGAVDPMRCASGGEYTFAANRSIVFADPSGLFWQPNDFDDEELIDQLLANPGWHCRSSGGVPGGFGSLFSCNAPNVCGELTHRFDFATRVFRVTPRPRLCDQIDGLVIGIAGSITAILNLIPQPLTIRRRCLNPFCRHCTDTKKLPRVNTACASATTVTSDTMARLVLTLLALVSALTGNLAIGGAVAIVEHALDKIKELDEVLNALGLKRTDCEFDFVIQLVATIDPFLGKCCQRPS